VADRSADLDFGLLQLKSAGVSTLLVIKRNKAFKDDTTFTAAINFYFFLIFGEVFCFVLFGEQQPG
jgi:hypothetical protein